LVDGGDLPRSSAKDLLIRLDGTIPIAQSKKAESSLAWNEKGALETAPLFQLNSYRA